MRVEVAALRTAAARLDQLAQEGVSIAAGARSLTGMDGSFGVMCAMIGVALTPVVHAGAGAASAAAGTSAGMAQTARWYAEAIETVDDQVCRTFTQMLEIVS